MSGTIWLAVAAALAAVVGIARFVLGKGTARRLEVGAVSDQWVAEHRRDADPNSR